MTVPMTRCLNTLDEIMGVPGEGVTPVVAESAKENDRGIQPSNRDVPIGTLTPFVSIPPGTSGRGPRNAAAVDNPRRTRQCGRQRITDIDSAVRWAAGPSRPAIWAALFTIGCCGCRVAASQDPEPPERIHIAPKAGRQIVGP